MDNILKVAVASGDGIVVNKHFGHANQFLIYEIRDENISYVETRSVNPVCNRKDHDDEKLENNMDAIKDCSYLLVSRIGYGASVIAEKKGIEPYEIPGIITESIKKLIKYIKLKELFN